ncbi:MAG: L-lactate permease [Spirochaetales bacterium]|nr:L-lactate permease [Spirochaetales bacterium]
MTQDIIHLLLALLPLAWLFVGIAKIKMPLYLVGITSLLLAAVISHLGFSFSPLLLAQASIEGFLIALFPIIHVILGALFVYSVSVESGGIEDVKALLMKVSPDRRIQGLLIAFAFGGFLESVTGFGTSVAIPAGILISMGFKPLRAAVLCLVANTVPVAFGLLGVPVITLARITALPVDILSVFTALQLSPIIILLPLVLVVIITRQLKGLGGVAVFALGSGIMFAAGQTLTAWFIGPELPAVVGAIAAGGFLVGAARMFPVKHPWTFEEKENTSPKQDIVIPPARALAAVSPYIIILGLTLVLRIPVIAAIFKNNIFSPGITVYSGEGAKSVEIAWATGAGTILLLSGVISGIIQKLSIRRIGRAMWHTMKKIGLTAVTVLSIVALARVMTYSNMVGSIAAAAGTFGMFFPLVSPFIGMLGTFLTGSDTSSNILFGSLQKQSAIAAGVSPEWLAAANTSGATAGKMISPQSLSIAAASTGLAGREKELFKGTVLFCIAYVAVMAVIVFVYTLF